MAMSDASILQRRRLILEITGSRHLRLRHQRLSMAPGRVRRRSGHFLRSRFLV